MCGVDWNAPASFLYGDLDDTKMLLMRERGAFTRGAARHEEIDSSVDLTSHQRAQSWLIQRQIFLEWRYQGGAATGEHVNLQTGLH